MKTIVRSVLFRMSFISLSILMMVASYYLCKYSYTYDSISVVLTKNNVVEYYTPNYNVLELVKESTGSALSVIKDVDTTKVGEQEVLLDVFKDNVSKRISVNVVVTDTTGPVIQLGSDNIYVYVGTTGDILGNIVSVSDKDNVLEYVSYEKVGKKTKSFYTVKSNVDFNNVGTYEVEVLAVDKVGNTTSKKFNVNVISNGREQGIRNTAFSLVGSPYVFAGTTPAGFDCSGFVMYVMARNGFFVGRNVSDQLGAGYAVSLDNIRVGDIIVWGYDGLYPSHSSIYVGNGYMIHAANPEQGVVMDKVAGWGNGLKIFGIRRLK